MKPQRQPLVSVIMPVRNEGGFIARALKSVLGQDYPADRMEVVVADGMSDDNTREIVKSFQSDRRVRLIDNPQFIVPTGLNAGIRQARGEIVVRVDGHCEIAPDYVSRCVEHLLSGEADAVGGPVQTVGLTSRAKAIASAMSSVFGVGASKFRTLRGRDLLVDTVAFPAYWRILLLRAGPFDEEFVRNQDDEYNYRLLDRGAKILLAADVKSVYYCRGSWTSLWKQYFQYGFWKVRVMQKHPRQMRWRQFVPPLFVSSLVISALMALLSRTNSHFFATVAGLYVLANLVSSIAAAREEPRLTPLIVVTFAIMHFAYGAGFWVGCFHFRKSLNRRTALSRAPTEWGPGLSWPASEERALAPVPAKQPGLRVLIVTQFYPPETGAAQNRLSDLAQRLSDFGNQVTVLTAMPNYPTGRVFERYRGLWVLEEQRNGVRVIRTWIYAHPTRNFTRRMMTYWSFVLSSLGIGLFRVGGQDVVVVESPPLFLGLAGVVISWLRQARFVMNVSDLWPESAVAMGVLRQPSLIRLSRWLEEFLYRQSDLITGQTRGIVDNIQKRCPDKRIAVITNGVDIERFDEVTASDRSEVREEWGVADAFVVGYAGLHGLAQGLETVLEAAEILKDREDVVFVFVGSGPVKDSMIRFQERAGLKNVRFIDNQPTSRVPAILAAFDAAVIPLKRLDLFRGALPSKLFEAMASGTPVVVAIEGEAKELVESAKAGICVPPEDPRAMSAAILRLRADESLCQSLSRSGRRYVYENYERRRIARDFDRLIRERPTPPAPPASIGAEVPVKREGASG
ncbi:MAG TPA: glycosyltransferase [Thermoanaerobaculia bacterium]